MISHTFSVWCLFWAKKKWRNMFWRQCFQCFEFLFWVCACFVCPFFQYLKITVLKILRLAKHCLCGFHREIHACLLVKVLVTCWFLFLTSVRYSWSHILSLPVCCIYFLSSCCSLRRFAQPYHHVGLSENRHAAMLAKLHGLVPFPHENDHKKV